MHRSAHWILAAYLLLCLLLGGASAAGLWGNALLQILAVPILLWAAGTGRASSLTRSGRQLLGLAFLMMLVPFLQLVPLPPEIWANLPGREHVRETFRLLEQPLPWLSISLAPHKTIASALWLLPPLAILFGLLRFGTGGGATLAWVIVGIMAVSVLIGALQITGGTDSPWYFYRITNYGVTVGFFSNANHMATLLVISLPFITALYATAGRKERSAHHSAPTLVMLIAAFFLVFVGLVINGSLAGIGLMVPVALASFLIILRRRRVPIWSIGLLSLLTVLSIGAVFSDRFDNNLIGSAAYSDPGARRIIFSNTLESAADYLPYGSGIGTFDAVYRMYEDPQSVTPTYINHAHSDYLELLLETGVVGVLVILLFLLWWGRQTLLIWRSSEPNHLARAATVATATILAHSIVDYPLRTVAIAGIFAVCCALMASPRGTAGRSSAPSRPARHLSAD